MALEVKKKRNLVYLFLVATVISVSSFAYLNLCTDNPTLISDYLDGISYADFRIDEIVLPDLQFFENSFFTIMELIFVST